MLNAARTVHVAGFVAAGGKLVVCPMCLEHVGGMTATDLIDGWIARNFNQASRFGAFLDPVADKIFAGITVVLLIFYRDLPLWLAAVILGRDLIIMLAGAGLYLHPLTVDYAYAGDTLDIDEVTHRISLSFRF